MHKKQIYTKLWTSSHGYHGNIKYHFKKTFQKINKYSIPRINAVSGGFICDFIIKKIISEITANQNEKQIHILCYGDNDARKNKNTPKSFIRKIETLLSAVKNVKNCIIIVTSILPSPETDANTKDFFRFVNQELKKISEIKNNNMSFLDMTKIFTKDKIILTDLYENDKIHLNSNGAKNFCKAVKQHLIWKNYF